ncbi:MAG: alpha/beta hydrolase [Flavobacteriales bacterium]|nr:alpha/beta hydrolase [Flavobacteriales bacterium]
MKKILWITSLLVAFCFNTSIVHAQKGIEIKDKVLIIDDFSSEYVKSRTIEIYFPKEYNADLEKKYPVLYMMDGQNMFDERTAYGGIPWDLDESIRTGLNNGELQPFIVVAVASVEARFHEYFPQKALKHLSSEEMILMEKARRERADYKSDFLADNFLKFVVEEVKPFVDKNYRTKTDRANTAIAGSSMGGLISLYAICEYPEVFGQAACISTHWPVLFDNDYSAPAESIRTYLKSHLPSPASHRIYFDHGTVTLDQYYEVHQKKVDQIMISKGYKKDVNWVTKKFEMADHHELAWKKRSNVFLSFLYGK